MRINPLIQFNQQTNMNERASLKSLLSTPPPPRCKKQLNVDTVHFSARIHERFPKQFLKELVMCGLPCPICGKEMFPLELLNEPAVDALRLFDANANKMTDINKIIFHKMAELAPLHPLKNMQELLQMLHNKAEKELVTEQIALLNELFSISGEFPKSRFADYFSLVNRTKERLLNINKLNDKKKFKRKNVINEFDDFALTLKDDKTRVKIMNTVRRLPTSENNRNAFIVKYSSRSPEEIGMKLYNKDFATMEHIIPESEGGKIVIWECSEDNAARGNLPIPVQIKQKPEMIGNTQKHFDRLIDIYYDDTVSPYLMAKKTLLKEYIFTIKNEYAIASHEILNVDISALGEIPAYIINREIRRIKEMGKTNYLRKLYQMLQEK